MPSFNTQSIKVDAKLKKVEEKLLKEGPKVHGESMNKKEFVEGAPDHVMKICDTEVTVKARKFARGKVGFYGQSKIPYCVDKRNYTLHCNATFYIPESEKWQEGPIDGEEDSDEKSSDDDGDSLPQAKRIKPERGHYMFRNVWIADAPAQELTCFGKSVMLYPKESKNTTSVGYFCDREFSCVVNGKEFLLKAAMSATVIGSKKWPLVPEK